MSSQPRKLGLNDLPAALNLKPMAVVENMNIETNILDPVVVNRDFCRFVLEKKGVLDSGSIFTFRLLAENAGMNARVHTPIRAGIHSVIRNATLKIGTKIVSQVQDYPYYKVIKRCFVSQEEKEGKHHVKYGTNDGLAPSTQPASATLEMKTGFQSGNNKLAYGALDLTSLSSTTAEFQIKLSDIFPLMRNIQLPLFVINEPVSVEFTFNNIQAEGQINISQADPGGGVIFRPIARLDPNSVQMVADYLTYDAATMNETAKEVMSDTGLFIPYEDLILTTNQIPVPVVTGQTHTTDIAVSGRKVRSIVVHTNRFSTNPLHGVYSSEGLRKGESYNFRINDTSMYPNDVNKEHKKMRELSKVFGVEIQVPKIEFDLDLQVADNGAENQNIITGTITYEGKAQRGSLEAKHNYIGVDLRTNNSMAVGNGLQIGQKPIQLVRKFDKVLAAENQASTQRIFAMVERAMILKDGNVSVTA